MRVVHGCRHRLRLAGPAGLGHRRHRDLLGQHAQGHAHLRQVDRKCIAPRADPEQTRTHLGRQKHLMLRLGEQAVVRRGFGPALVSDVEFAVFERLDGQTGGLVQLVVKRIELGLENGRQNGHLIEFLAQQEHGRIDNGLGDAQALAHGRDTRVIPGQQTPGIAVILQQLRSQQVVMQRPEL